MTQYAFDPNDTPATLSGKAAAAAVSANRLQKFRGSAITRAMVSRTVMTTPPTITENASSAVTSAVTHAPTSTSIRVSGAPTYQSSSSPVTFRPRESARIDGTVQAGVEPLRIDFLWQGTVLEIPLFAGSNRKYAIWCDGQLAAAGMVAGPVQLGITNATSYVRMDFGSRVAAPIHVTAELVGATQWVEGIKVEPTATIVRPSITSPRVLVLGDSYSAMGTATDRSLGYLNTLFRRLGWSDYWVHSAVSSTGVVTATGTYPDYRARLAADILPYAPDVLFVQGSINDSAAAGTNTVGPGLAKIISDNRAVWPACEIVVSSPLVARVTSSQTNLALVTAEMAATSATFGVPFYDLCTGNPYFYGTGYAGATNGTGNSDFLCDASTTHPNQAGHDTLGLILARFFAETFGVSAA